MLIDIEKEAQDLKDYWQDRDTQMREDRETVNLVKPIPKTDAVQWISNEPKVFYDTAIALVSSYQPTFRLPLTINYEPEEKEKMNKAERMLIGIFRSLDGRQMSRGHSYWLRELAYWVLSGWYAIFNVVMDKKNPQFIADFWDPMTVYPEWDADGLSKCVRLLEVDAKVASSLLYEWQKKGAKVDLELPEGKSSFRIINYWRREKSKGKSKVSNAIMLADKVVKPLTVERFEHIPIHVGAVGQPDMITPGWQKRRGEHIIAVNRDMYKYINALLSLMVTIVDETAFPNIITQTRSGRSPVDDLKGHGEVVPLKLEDKISLLQHATTPGEALQALQLVLKQQQKGSFPDVVYGGVPVELSGFAISQLMAAIKYKISPYLVMMKTVMGNISSDFLSQYKKGGFSKISLSTENAQEMKKGLFFVEEFSPQDVPETIFVKVDIPITSALDKVQQIMFARQALQPPQLLSRETLWDEVLEIQDSEQEYARIIQDEILELPIMKEIASIESLRDRLRLYEQRGKTGEAQALKRYIMALEMQLGMRKGVPVTSESVPPSFSPPEAGSPSPDQIRAIQGIPPSGLRRRPQTPEERVESQGRRGSLVSPTGEILI